MEPRTGSHRENAGSRPHPTGGRPYAMGGRSSASMLGSVTIPGCAERVRDARRFIRHALEPARGIDCEAATLLTSELVTNAIQHTRSGTSGGTVTVVVEAVPDGVLVQVIDDGAADVPVVKGAFYAAEGHGLFLVQRLATQWGYLRGPAGTTVWFHLALPGQPDPAGAPHLGAGRDLASPVPMAH